jgi:predicted unusual protein kinase regulating ubiquinone biosynthesis (AarF/ABC1/UbiB family)
LGRTALAGVRGGLLALRHDDNAELDIEAVAAVVASVGQLKGIAMKAAQLMSYLDLPVSSEFRSAFAVLQTHSPPMPFDRVSAIVQEELGERASPLLANMERAPRAAASIGQVHRATLPEGVSVAVKIQYPGIESAIAADFRSAGFAKNFASVFAPGANIDAMLQELRRAIFDECDYQREAGFQQRFADIYAGHPILAVPEVHAAYGARHVLTTTWVEGLRFDEYLATNPPASERNRVGEALFEFYVGTLFRHGIYNWDPHPGNYIFCPDGRVAMLDYGSTREFDREFVAKLAALSRAVHADTHDALYQAFAALGMFKKGDEAEFEVARTLVRSFYGPMLHDETRLMHLGDTLPLRSILDNKRKLLKLNLPGQLMFTLRIRFGVMSVLARLGASANWYRLEQQFTQEARDPQ